MRDISRRDLTLGSAAVGMTALMPAGAIAMDSAAPTTADLSFVNSELRPTAAAIQKMFGSAPRLSSATLPTVRQRTSQFSQPPATTPTVDKRAIKGAAGSPDVVIYIINAKPGTARPAILHTHGGGYVMGSARDSIGALQSVASELDCVIVTVEYRLAPETTYAGSIEDNYAGLRWLHDHAAELGADPKRIAVMGESAGGGHAALLALTARDRGEVPLIFQALIYPMLDDRVGTTVQPPSPIGSLVWKPDANHFGWKSFLGQEPGTASVPTRAVPARYKSLAGLPPAWIGVGSIDLFVDEDIDYARRLLDSGIATELAVVPGAFHGFDGIAAQTSVAKRFTAAKIDALRRAFTTAPG